MMKTRICTGMLLAAVVCGACTQQGMVPDHRLAPAVSGTLPEVPALGPAAQSITVTGSQFLPGLRLTVVQPKGGIVARQGSDIQGLTPTSSQVVLTLDVGGMFQLTVTNLDGLSSAPFGLTPQPAPQAIW